MADVESRPQSLTQAFDEVLKLQPAFTAMNSPEMQRRGYLIRNEGPVAIRALLASHFPAMPFDLGVEGRDGTGLKTRVPWIRIFSRSASPSATEGWYVVYLFAFDGSAVYLSLNQGTTTPERGQFRVRPNEDLDARTKWARQVLVDRQADLVGLDTSMRLADNGGLGDGYERGNVYAVRYEAGTLPDEGVLGADLRRMVELLTLLYGATGAPSLPSRRVDSLGEGGKRRLSDITAFIASVREEAGPDLVASRAAAEQQARDLLEATAGRMDRSQAIRLGELFNTGSWGGILRHNRFTPAFVGATMARLIDPIEAFNSRTGGLWRSTEDQALRLVDDILRDSQVFPGAGRSYPTMLMYLRDPQKYAIWLEITHRALAAIGRLDEPNDPRGGADRYLRYCKAAHDFAEEFGLQPQELDAIFAEIARAAVAEKTTVATEMASLVEEVVQDGDEQEPVNAEYPLSQVAAVTYLPIEQLEEWVTLLRGQKQQALIYGPPGTGKTFIAQQLARHLAGADGEVGLVQFHPSFSYEDFIEGLRPAPGETGTNVRYEIRPGIFRQFCDRARGRSGTFVFIVDEINRAELGAVLGELMMLLEYRGRQLRLPYSQELFSVPGNVVLLATMNTADRSLALVDFALRRRFHALALRPSGDVLEKYLAAREEPPNPTMGFFNLVQESVDNVDFAPGHAYWMTDDLTAQGLFRVWKYELQPYLEEYWFEHRSRLEDLGDRVAKLLAEEA